MLRQHPLPGRPLEPRFFAIDASIFIFRAYFAGQPPGLISGDAEFAQRFGAVAGFLRFLLSFRMSICETPTGGESEKSVAHYALLAFDESLGRGWREQLYPLYKDNRALPDADLARQLAACRSIGQALGFPCAANHLFEADDLLAAGAAVAREAQLPLTVVSGDKDLGQLLLAADDLWWDGRSAPISRQRWQARQGLAPEHLADFLALAGDRSDNIPGVQGVGKVAALKIINKYNSLESVFSNLNEISVMPLRGAAGVAARLEAQKDEAFLFRQLCRLRADAPRLGELEAYRLEPFFPPRLAECLEQIGMPADYIDNLQQRFSPLFKPANGGRAA
ncbi:5'-3' exonuclease H3TH domain-containing protein [Spongiibacter taiwanensis]